MHRPVQVLKLGVAVRVFRPRQGLAIGVILLMLTTSSPHVREKALSCPGALPVVWLPARGYGPVGLVLVLRVRFALAGAGRGLLEIWPESGVSRVDSYT